MSKELPPITVPQCTCRVGHPSFGCPYMTEQHINDVRASHRNMPNEVLAYIHHGDTPQTLG